MILILFLALSVSATDHIAYRTYEKYGSIELRPAKCTAMTWMNLADCYPYIIDVYLEANETVPLVHGGNDIVSYGAPFIYDMIYGALVGIILVCVIELFQNCIGKNSNVNHSTEMQSIVPLRRSIVDRRV